MKKIIYSLMAVLAISAFTACDNGNTELGGTINLPPQISFGEYGVFFDNRDGAINVTVQDGVEGSELTTITSITYQIVAFDGTEQSNGTVPGSDNLVEATIAIAAGSLSPNATDEPYSLIVTSNDSAGESSTETAEFNVFRGFNTIGIIGDATPGGWGADTDMTDVGDGVYEVTIDLAALSAKFRADDAWDVAWGSTDFPSGTGDSTPGSPNIPIAEAGTYKVTFDSKDSSYNFEKQ